MLIMLILKALLTVLCARYHYPCLLLENLIWGRDVCLWNYLKFRRDLKSDFLYSHRIVSMRKKEHKRYGEATRKGKGKTAQRILGSSDKCWCREVSAHKRPPPGNGTLRTIKCACSWHQRIVPVYWVIKMLFLICVIRALWSLEGCAV